MVEMVGVCHVMWFVMLESTMDRVIGVDTPGQRCHHMSGMEPLAY
jgi:hypothetical protein